MSDEELQRLADVYVNEKSDRNKEALSRISVPIAKGIGRNYAFRRNLPYSLMDQADSDSMLGLVQAIDRWDPERCPIFAAYLTQRVKSCIMDGLRSTDHLVRSHRKELRDAGVEEADNFKPPLSINGTVSASVDIVILDMLSDEREDLNDTERSAQRELVAAVLPAMHDLKKFRPSHFKALSSFVTGVSSREIAKELGVTESRVSQLRKEGIKFIQEALCGTQINPTKRGPEKRCLGPGCTNTRPRPTGRPGRPAVYCSDECKKKAQGEKNGTKQLKDVSTPSV